jgi:6-pyruvoyltetrahydropterin/6-carboxytetrahydropterin synthase
MALVYVSRRERFNAAHKLWNNNWSAEKNNEIFGKCANENWHGHNYELFVTVKGKPNVDTGYVVDLKALGDEIKEHVTEKLDHKNLNLDVDFMKDVIASTENLSIAIWNILAPIAVKLGGTLHSIKLYETENNFVEYLGE